LIDIQVKDILDIVVVHATQMMKNNNKCLLESQPRCRQTRRSSFSLSLATVSLLAVTVLIMGGSLTESLSTDLVAAAKATSIVQTKQQLRGVNHRQLKEEQEKKEKKEKQVDDAVIEEELEHLEEEIEELDNEDGDKAEKEKQDLEELAEELIEETFPPECSWECYMANYKWINKHVEHTEEEALKYYIKHGKKNGRDDCTCKDDATIIEEVEEVEKEIEELDSQGGAEAEKEKEDLEAVAEDLIETTFPPGCSWECYMTNYKFIDKHIEHTEEAALKYYLEKGLGNGKDDCTCRDDKEIFEKIDQVAEEIEELETKGKGKHKGKGKGDDKAEKKIKDLEELEEELIETTFPPECSWECYLSNYKFINKKVEHTEEAALKHWLKHGKARGKDCTCKDDAVIKKEVEKVEEEIEELDKQGGVEAEEKKEELEELAEELIETTFPPGCSWECYLDNYKVISSRIEHTEEAALKHYLEHGKARGRDCSCKVAEIAESEFPGENPAMMPGVMKFRKWGLAAAIPLFGIVVYFAFFRRSASVSTIPSGGISDKGSGYSDVPSDTYADVQYRDEAEAVEMS